MGVFKDGQRNGHRFPEDLEEEDAVRRLPLTDTTPRADISSKLGDLFHESSVSLAPILVDGLMHEEELEEHMDVYVALQSQNSRR